MPLETALYIDTLQPDWPLGTDPESQGDDHLRMLKQVLQNTYPNIAAPVTATADEFNQLAAGWTYHPADADSGRSAYWRSGDPFYDPDPDDPEPPADLPLPVSVGTETAAQMAAHPSYAVNYDVIMQMIYPVGAVIFNTGANPLDTLGFGVWTAREGTMYGVGSMVDWNDASQIVTLPAGPITGGVLIDSMNMRPFGVSLTGSTDQEGLHNHAAPVEHGNGPTSTQSIAGSAWDGSRQNVTTNAGTSSDGLHTHSVAVSGTLGTGSQLHKSPGYAFYVWERTE